MNISQIQTLHDTLSKLDLKEGKDVPDEILESENFEKKCGTFLMKKIIRQTAVTVDDAAEPGGCEYAIFNDLGGIVKITLGSTWTQVLKTAPTKLHPFASFCILMRPDAS